MKQKLPLIIMAAVAAAVLLFVIRPQIGGNQPEDTAAPPTITTGIEENKEMETVTAIELDYENTIIMQLSTGGPVVIETYPDKAPNHVARFKELARQDYYDGIVFHRVIEGFMAQTGDPTGTGSGGSGQNIDAEFNDIMHERGVVSTARAQDPNSADSQFFIMLAGSTHLDGQYTAWGRVVQGMEYIDAITRGPQGDNGVVPIDQRDSIVSMRVLVDVGEDALNDAE